MVQFNIEYLRELEEYIASGHFHDEFMHSVEEKRLEMLEFLEKLMDLGEKADDTATRIIFRKSQES